MALILTPRQLSTRADFYYQLAQLTAAGLTLVKALELLANKPPARSYREPLRKVLQHLAQGDTFYEALTRVGPWTPSFDIALIRAGEHSGRLDAVCRLLAAHYADRAALLRKILTDLAYPAFLLHFAVVLFPFITFFNDGNLLRFALKVFGVLIPLYATIGFLVYAAQGRRGAWWRATMETVLNPIPLLGSARRSLALARLAAALEALINAGVTIIEAWDMAVVASGSFALQRAVVKWRPRVVAGETPAEAVSAAPQFPEVFSNLYRSAELSGQLDDALQRLHAYYQEEGTRKLHIFTRVMTQGTYLSVMLVVAYKVVMFYTVYFNQIQKIGS